MPLGGDAQHDEGRARVAKGFGRRVQCRIRSHRGLAVSGDRYPSIGRIARDVLRQLEVHGSGSAFTHGAKRIVNDVGDLRTAFDRPCGLSDRCHYTRHVEQLVQTLAILPDGFLAGDEQHREAPEMGMGYRGGQVRRARSERGIRNGDLSGEPSVGRRHEAARLLLSDEDRANLGVIP